MLRSLIYECTRYRIPASLLALLLAATACGNEVEEPNTGSRMRTLEPPQQPLTVEGTSQDQHVANPELKPLVEMAVQDLAAKLGAKAEDIDVLEARYVTWPDSSLGCPRPDLEYMQVLTDGVLIVLRHGSTSYHYHGRHDGPPFYCERPRKPAAGQPGEATS